MSQPAVHHQPPAIRAAVRLMWLGAAVSAVQLVVWLARLDHLKASVRRQMSHNGRAYSQSAFDFRFGAALVVGLVSGIAFVALWTWTARRNGQGLSWARVVASWLTAFTVVSTILTFTVHLHKSSVYYKGSAIFDVVLTGAIATLLWRKESSEFYAACESQITPPTSA